MKKYLTLPAVAALTLTIAACSNTGTDAPQADFAAPPPPPANSAPMDAPAPGGDPMGMPPASGL